MILPIVGASKSASYRTSPGAMTTPNRRAESSWFRATTGPEPVRFHRHGSALFQSTRGQPDHQGPGVNGTKVVSIWQTIEAVAYGARLCPVVASLGRYPIEQARAFAARAL